ncbi:hypothetical protein EHP00_1648 [Ecytonucleospora hepatopenaei]|uniref:Uncharacterized protein n=1 Tax=Ecytonucleospora hepatopenaei TaxID=646526 RepID=A0A1W0E9B1_9MICR|nr:hypothetical protein EHP00_1648 [Ecytonucleospora hepatopenaei]
MYLLPLIMIHVALKYLMNLLSCVALCFCASSIMGILTDQITMRICLEYFTEGFHKPLNDTNPFLVFFNKNFKDDITVQAIAWGIFATYILGLSFGGVLFLLNFLPYKNPPVKYKNIIFIILLGLPLVLVCNFLVGYIIYASKFKNLNNDNLYKTMLGFNISKTKTDFLSNRNLCLKYLYCASVHWAAYIFGPILGAVVLLYVIYKRFIPKFGTKKEEETVTIS